MAAVIATLENYMQTMLLITSPTARTALGNQGLNNYDDFLTLTEKDIADICSNVRKPGGTIANPALVAGGNQPALIPNPGTPIGYVFEKRLKMLRYYRLHLQRIQRPFDDTTATLARLANVYALKEEEDLEDDDDVRLPTKLTDINKVRMTLEDIDDYLNRKRGISGVPLTYSVRADVALPDAGDDPGFGLPSYALEMIRRAPHTGAFYQRDNVAVWNVIRHVTHEGPAWSWVQQYVCTCDGRSAYYFAMKQHYLGESFTARLRANADRLMDSTFYDGRSRAFTFEQFCETLQQAFTDIESTGEVISEQRKVRILMTAIRDDRLATAKSQVTATPELKAMFDAAVNFISQFLDERRAITNNNHGMNPPRNVSVVNANPGRGRGSGGGGRGTFGRGGSRNNGRGGGRYNGRGGNRNNGRGSMGISDKYYTKAEWDLLSQEEQQRVRDLRSNRDRQRGVHAVDTSRSVRQRTDDGSSVPSAASTSNASTTSSITTGVGAGMSQRANRML